MKHDSIYDFEVMTLQGKRMSLREMEGKVLLIVNVASHCGLTPQLEGLQLLYDRYREQGLEILAFPSNDFYQQPEDGAEIQMFCQDNYGVSFTIFEKGIVKGTKAQPLYQFLADKSRVMGRKIYPMWNFQKYLVNSRGQVVDYFMPWTKPESAKLTDSIEKELTKQLVEK